MKVFISHASSDKHLARRVAEALGNAGLTTWDDSEILPGDNWAAKIAQGLEESQAMIVLLTPAALDSERVQQEISYALGSMNYRHRLIPVLAGPSASLPDEKIPWILKRFAMFPLPEGGNNPAALEHLAQSVKDALQLTLSAA